MLFQVPIHDTVFKNKVVAGQSLACHGFCTGTEYRHERKISNDKDEDFFLWIADWETVQCPAHTVDVETRRSEFLVQLNVLPKFFLIVIARESPFERFYRRGHLLNIETQIARRQIRAPEATLRHTFVE